MQVGAFIRYENTKVFEIIVYKLPAEVIVYRNGAYSFCLLCSPCVIPL